MVLTNLKETLQAQVMIPFHLLLKNYCLYISLAFGKTFRLCLERVLRLYLKKTELHYKGSHNPDV
jgi:hypothetical protein